jgi:hypothetical protein
MLSLGIVSLMVGQRNDDMKRRAASMVGDMAAFKQTASTHAFRTPQSSCAFLVCIEKIHSGQRIGGREEGRETRTIRVYAAQSARAVAC